MDKPGDQQYGNFAYFTDKKEIPMLAGSLLNSVMQGAIERGVSYGEMENWVFTIHTHVLGELAQTTHDLPKGSIGTIAVKSTPKKYFKTKEQ